VTDGGQISPQDIEAATSNHVESVRRTLRRIDDLVQREYGEVALRSSTPLSSSTKRSKRLVRVLARP